VLETDALEARHEEMYYGTKLNQFQKQKNGTMDATPPCSHAKVIIGRLKVALSTPSLYITLLIYPHHIHTMLAG
jgi:hypothetical protein